MLKARSILNWSLNFASPSWWAAHLCLVGFSLVATDVAAQTRAKTDEPCLAGAEVRELVDQKAVLAPGPVLKKARATSGSGSKVLRAVLCRRDGQYVYRITLLRRDGRVVQQLLPARAGRGDAPRAGSQ